MTEDFVQALDRTAKAHDAMWAGDPEPMIGLFAHRDPVSLFGAWGPCRTEWPEVERTVRWAGSRFSNGVVTAENVVAYSSGELAYSVGYERGRVAVDGGEPEEMRMRVTHIYRLEDGQWRLVHRHADFAPTEQSPPG